MKYRCVFHIRKQPDGRLSRISIELNNIDVVIDASQDGLWVNDEYELDKFDARTYWLPPHKIEYIERIEAVIE